MYTLLIILLILALMLVIFMINRKRNKLNEEMLIKLSEENTISFTKQEQLEMIFNNDFHLLHERLNIKSIPRSLISKFFTITRLDLKAYIHSHRDILQDKNITKNKFDGFWTEKKEDVFYLLYRERGQICRRTKVESLEKLEELYANEIILKNRDIFYKDKSSFHKCFISS